MRVDHPYFTLSSQAVMCRTCSRAERITSGGFLLAISYLFIPWDGHRLTHIANFTALCTTLSMYLYSTTISDPYMPLCTPVIAFCTVHYRSCSCYRENLNIIY